jgi:hypothetical protein
MSCHARATAPRSLRILRLRVSLVHCTKPHDNGHAIQRPNLFNPRTDDWRDHFSMTKRFLIFGRTAIGRATVEALTMNRDAVIAIRKELVLLGRYPIKS